MATVVKQLMLMSDEASRIRSLLAEIKSDGRLLNQYCFLEEATTAAHELPKRIRREFYRFKRDEQGAALLVRNNPVLENGPGPTPSDYPETVSEYQLNDLQLLQGLYGSLLGEAIGFTSQRGGSIYNNIVPRREQEASGNSSAGSRLVFGFHTEDAFHPARPDYISLACMRNVERAATTISCIDGVELTEVERYALFKPNFRIIHNPIHATSGVINEEAQSILFGNVEKPYVRINAATLSLSDYTGLERRALEKLLHHFVSNCVSIRLRSRDCLFIDNYRSVHSRDSFKPRYGSNARWLSRVVFTVDLRKSRALRLSQLDRAIAA
jgi:hypothetical protein